MIYIHIVDLESVMLHAKFQDRRPLGSGEDFYSFLSYMVMAAILVMCPGLFIYTLVPPLL